MIKMAPFLSCCIASNPQGLYIWLLAQRLDCWRCWSFDRAVKVLCLGRSSKERGFKSHRLQSSLFVVQKRWWLKPRSDAGPGMVSWCYVRRRGSCWKGCLLCCRIRAKVGEPCIEGVEHDDIGEKYEASKECIAKIVQHERDRAEILCKRTKDDWERKAGLIYAAKFHPKEVRVWGGLSVTVYHTRRIDLFR